jgi:nucleoid DNA-binding protein
MNNRKDFAKEIADEYNISTNIAQKIVVSVFDQIANKITKEGRIELRNFGVFKAVRREARKAKNPKNGKEHFVPVRYYVRFKPGKALIGKITEYNLMQNPQE